jgi:intracellular septation protein
MQWISLGLIVVFGGATLFLQDERFIKAKPSLLYGIFAIALLVPQIISKVHLIEKLLGGKVALPSAVWGRINAAWGLFFLGMALLNAWVAMQFSTDIWVDFKVFGTLLLTVVFVIAQAVYMRTPPRDRASRGNRITAQSGVTRGRDGSLGRV